MQILIGKRLEEGTSDYSKIKNLKIALVYNKQLVYNVSSNRHTLMKGVL